MRFIHVAFVLVLFAATGTPQALPSPTETDLDGQLQSAMAAKKYDQALPLAQQLLALREKRLGADHADVAGVLHTLGVIDIQQAHYDLAEPLLKRALSIREKALGPDSLELAADLSQLGRIYQHREDYGQAEPVLQRALAIREKALGADSAEVSSSLADLGLLYQGKGDLNKAGSSYQRALAIQEKVYGADDPRLADLLDDLGGLYLYKGDDRGAEETFQRALKLYEKGHGPDYYKVGAVSDNLGAVYVKMHQYDRAEPLIERALTILEKSLGPYHPDVAECLRNLGGLYMRKADYERSEQALKRFQAIEEKVFGPESSMAAGALNELAQLYQLKHDYAQAETLYKRAIAVYERVFGVDSPRVVSLYQNMSAFYWARGEGTPSREFMTRARDTEERDLSLILAAGSERDKRNYIEDLRTSTDSIVSLHTRLAPKDPAALDFALESVLQRKGRVLDAVAQEMETLRASLSPDDRHLLDQLVQIRSRRAALVFRGPGNSKADEYAAEIKDLRQQEERLELGISSRSASFRQQVAPVTLARVKAALPKETALVEIVLYTPFDMQAAEQSQMQGDDFYAAYILFPDRQAAWVELGKTAPIDALTAKRRALGTQGSSDTRQVARDLDELVMRPLRPLLGGVRRVWISPDGPLNMAPFAALVDEHGKPLVESFEFTYLTSGRDLLRIGHSAANREPPLVLANPTFDHSAALPSGTRSTRLAPGFGMQFPPLPGAEEEARTIAGLLPGARLLTGDAATEEALKKVSGPRLLHIATHGFFLAPSPGPAPDTRGVVPNQPPAAPPDSNPLLRSGLALAGANHRASGGEDGILTALEASGLDLWGTQLVVLSACETGIGEVIEGDGVYGLRRAFFLAGAQSVLMSLWKVDDQATRDLMVGYYRKLLAGEGRSAALRAVQLEMLRDPKRSDPYYWAAFIPAGDSSPLPH